MKTVLCTVHYAVPFIDDPCARKRKLFTAQFSVKQTTQPAPVLPSAPQEERGRRRIVPRGTGETISTRKRAGRRRQNQLVRVPHAESVSGTGSVGEKRSEAKENVPTLLFSNEHLCTHVWTYMRIYTEKDVSYSIAVH